MLGMDPSDMFDRALANIRTLYAESVSWKLFVVAVPDLGGGEARRQLLDLRAGRPAADLAAE